MQFQLFPSRDKPFCGFPNPELVPVRTRSYVRLCGILFRRDKHTPNWWSVQSHSAAFELTEMEVARIPTFMREADMESYVERLVAFEMKQTITVQ